MTYVVTVQVTLDEVYKIEAGSWERAAAYAANRARAELPVSIRAIKTEVWTEAGEKLGSWSDL